jgi:hypothetical protein
MAYYKIETTKKGLVAKMQAYVKDFETGKNKIFTKRVYNDKNLTEAKFEKKIEKLAIEFEEQLQQAYKDQTNQLRNNVLNF